jgi:DsbC/DsbD-like thiol-disulfide interchange protein
MGAPLRAADTDYGQVRLLNGWQLPDGSMQAALEFDLNPGWKTYWRAPGPNGIPPSFDWLGSGNIGAIDIAWPTPHLVGAEGAEAVGYTGKTIIPIRFTPATDGPMRVALYLEFGVCADICIPASLSILHPLDPTQTEGRAAITAALHDVPHDGMRGGVSRFTCSIMPAATGYDVQADLRLSQTATAPYVVIEYDDANSWILGATSAAQGRNLRAQGQIRFMGGSGMIQRDRLRMTVLADGNAWELSGCPAG